MFVVTTSVVTSLLGDRQVTHPCPDPPVPSPALNPLMVSVTTSAMKRQQVVTLNAG
ncbi:MAG: hypothetical protein ACRC8Y_05450 [Chroococcales cyanobacterium]